ncbi:MAG: hypothetical protein GSR81_05495 [Desulfurococcales archaeon]|nr:hypothetical protein [Desulfurococcales archaeon]
MTINTLDSKTLFYLCLILLIVLGASNVYSSGPTGQDPSNVSLVIVENSYLTEDYEFDDLRDMVLMIIDSGTGCASSILGEPVKVYDSNDLWNVVYAKIYEYRNAILVVTDLGFYYFEYYDSQGAEYYSSLVSDPSGVIEVAYKQYISDSDINISVGEPVRDETYREIYPLYIEGIRTVYNITIQGYDNNCIKASLLEGWIPIRPNITRITVSHGNDTRILDIVLVPYGNLSLGVKLYPYVTMISGTSRNNILLLPGANYKEITINNVYWPDFTYIIDTGRKAYSIKKTFFTIATVIIVMLAFGIAFRLRKKFQQRGNDKGRPQLILPRD